MKRSVESKDIIRCIPEIDVIGVVMHVVVQQCPIVFNLVAQLARQFRWVSQTKNWFSIYVRDFVQRMHLDNRVYHLYMGTTWATRLVYFAFCRFERGLMDWKEYRSVIAQVCGCDKLVDFGLNYLDRQVDFSFPKYTLGCIRTVFYYMSAPMKEWDVPGALLFIPIISLAWGSGISEDDLIKLLSKMPGRTLATSCLVDAILLGYSDDVLKKLLAKKVNWIGATIMSRIRKAAVSRLLDRFGLVPRLDITIKSMDNSEIWITPVNLDLLRAVYQNDPNYFGRDYRGELSYDQIYYVLRSKIPEDLFFVHNRYKNNQIFWRGYNAFAKQTKI
jgi:hypothetical protein